MHGEIRLTLSGGKGPPVKWERREIKQFGKVFAVGPRVPGPAHGIPFSAILNTVVYLPLSGYWTYRLTAHKCE